ncbi:LPXTG cell wall anchor domain-containing protein [Winogradskyella bathintestinalis]|uniref:LPXTG cell wall anchor domain-containing protein n=1 Tax=Winogradskyella bathintestinalis TaxID=3035208 RepID=A0ABT7ZSL9_9FLAO|nr:LPXTG cell wall anchor domain-containing protein [Winogradskyella bathintestinalis]MDN3491988.1 LPXTG cell wall anchor domain-containing protein [Winogradskyella bathintestinalis]
MKIQKIFQYAYIVFAMLFIYDGIIKWSEDRTGAYVSLGLAALAIFMFFFRKRFNKKFDDRNKK